MSNIVGESFRRPSMSESPSPSRGSLPALKGVSGACYPEFVPPGNVCVDHRRRNVRVAKELLDGADVVAAFHQMRGKAVTERMHRGVLHDSGSGDGKLELALEARWIQVVSAYLARSRIYGKLRRRKHP